MGMFTDPTCPCPCQSGKAFGTCCAPYLNGDQQAPTAEALMRSRYSAFFFGHTDYLYQTHHPTHRSANERAELTSAIRQTRWTGLEIIACEKGQPTDKEGRVTFQAFYEQGGTPGVLRECSRFVREQGRWYYLCGEISASAEPAPDRHGKPSSRNAPCWCGSGKKFKRCHGVNNV